jgi:hypothetical protein
VEVTVIKKQFRRAMAIGMAASTLAALTAAGGATGALGASTRDIFIGDPDGANGVLHYTQTHVGGLAAVDIQVRNRGGQTVNHTSLVGGDAANNAASNPLFPKPTTDSLPDALTYAEVFEPSGVTCEWSATSLSCDIGTLPAGQAKTIRVVIQTPTSGSATSWETWYGAYLAESNQTGTNQDNFYAFGTVRTSSATCSGTDPNANTDANYFLPQTKVNLLTANCGNALASVGSKNALSGVGGFGKLSIDSTNQTACPAPYTCVGAEVEATVLDGDDVPGGLQWDITWYGIRTASGVIHFLDTYDATDPDHDTDYTVIPFTNKFHCSTKLTTNCWVTIAASKPTANPLWIKVTVITPNNGTKRILA